MEQDSHTEEGQIERARRLREQIERLKTGLPPRGSQGPKSLKEQIAEREQADDPKK